MRELASVGVVVLAFACASFAQPSRRPSWLGVRFRPWQAHALGAVLWGLAVAVVADGDGAYGALFVVTAGGVVATVFPLARGVVMRAGPRVPLARTVGPPTQQEGRSTLAWSWLARALAAFFAPMPGAALLGLGLTLHLPFALETRFAIGFGLIFAFWLTALCLLWLARSLPRALGWTVAFTALGALLSVPWP